MAVCLPLTVAAVPVTVATWGHHDIKSEVTWGVAYTVGLVGLIAIATAWSSHHRLKKIDQAGKAAAHLADAADSTASPLERRGKADV